MQIKAINLTKYTIRVTTNLVMIAKKKQLNKQYFIKYKVNKKYFNYRKKGYHIKNRLFSNKKKYKKLVKEAKLQFHLLKAYSIVITISVLLGWQIMIFYKAGKKTEYIIYILN